MNYVVDKPELLPIIQQQWSTHVDGFGVFQVVKKLKGLKRHVKNLKWSYGNAYEKVANLKEKLKIAQTKMDANPHDSIIKVEEAKILLEYKEAIRGWLYSSRLSDRRKLILSFHPQRKMTIDFDLQITHLCFADDLLVLCNGDIGSIRVIKQTLQEFSKASGLVPSLHKSIVFFKSVPLDSQQLILAELPFSVGEIKVQDWKNKDLSYAGFSWWLLCFLWCGGELQKGKAKVSWKSVCHPKNQGGLGLKMIGEWNEVLLSKHIWNIVSGKESLWIKWVRMKGLFTNLMPSLADFSDYAPVAEMTSHGRWMWPEECNDGSLRKFSTKQVWQDCIVQFPNVPWSSVVWFSQCIPSHAFVAWLAIQGRLLT
ncbi:RNA-directed DNA polymerase, eukaryota, reverse transcriptase zinc-binding domain protein [Tanacetum coccineum]